MESIHGLPSEQSQLLGVVRGVRNRYRAKRALRGAAITVAASWAVLLVASYAMSVLKYGDAAVLTTRILSVVAIVGIIARFIVRPLLPKFRDDQVALYLEEHEKSLSATVITAVEMQSAPRRATSGLRSPAIIERLTRGALERVHKTGDGRAIDAGELGTERRHARRGDVQRDSRHGIRSADAATWRSLDHDAENPAAACRRIRIRG